MALVDMALVLDVNVLNDVRQEERASDVELEHVHVGVARRGHHLLDGGHGGDRRVGAIDVVVEARPLSKALSDKARLELEDAATGKCLDLVDELAADGACASRDAVIKEALENAHADHLAEELDVLGGLPLNALRTALDICVSLGRDQGVGHAVSELGARQDIAFGNSEADLIAPAALLRGVDRREGSRGISGLRRAPLLEMRSHAQRLGSGLAAAAAHAERCKRVWRRRRR